MTRGIRAIHQGTRYDLTGNLRRIAREIERGQYGDVRNIVCAFDTHSPGPNTGVKLFCWGNGGVADSHWILSTAKNRMEPS